MIECRDLGRLENALCHEYVFQKTSADESALRGRFLRFAQRHAEAGVACAPMRYFTLSRNHFG